MSRLYGAEEAAEAAKQFAILENTLLEHRTLTIFGEIDKDCAQRCTERLLAMAFKSDDPITVFIGSPGGHVESGDTIFDMIRYIKPVVRTVGTGWVGSIATHIYLAAEREQRYALPNTRFLIHQPAGGFGGDASRLEEDSRADDVPHHDGQGHARPQGPAQGRAGLFLIVRGRGRHRLTRRC